MPLLILGWSMDTVNALKLLGEPAIIVAAHRRVPRFTKLLSPPQWRIPVEDHSSAECVLLALERLPSTVRVDAVHTSDEFSLVTAALLARTMEVPGPDLAVSCLFRDKVMQKSALRKAGIPVADWRELDGTMDDMAVSCDSLGYPLVI